jgi:hypothetical protein
LGGLFFVEVFSRDGEVFHVVEKRVIGSSFQFFANLEAQKLRMSFKVADLFFIVQQGLEDRFVIDEARFLGSVLDG